MKPLIMNKNDYIKKSMKILEMLRSLRNWTKILQEQEKTD